MKKTIMSAVTAISVFALLCGPVTAEQPSEDVKDLEKRIRAGKELLSKQDALYASLDGMISAIQQIRLKIPGSMSWNDMDTNIVKGFDLKESKRLFSLLSETSSSLNAEIVSDAVKEYAGAVAKETDKAAASVAKLEDVLRMTPEQVAGKMKADGSLPGLSGLTFPKKPPKGMAETKPDVIKKMLESGEAIKVEDIERAAKPDEQGIFSGRARYLSEACEPAIRDLQQLRLSLTALDRALGASSGSLQDELRMVKFRALGKSEEAVTNEKK
ncbi:MAG: hypothetical protein ABIA77_05330 [Candidatus Omnitrophota bacterium]